MLGGALGRLWWAGPPWFHLWLPGLQMPRPRIQAGSRRGSHLWTAAPSLAPAHPHLSWLLRWRGPLERSLCLQRGPRSSPTPAALQPPELAPPALLGETAASGPGAGEAQGEPGASASLPAPKTHPHWQECVRKTATQTTRFLNGQDWDWLGSISSKLLTENKRQVTVGERSGFGMNVLTLLYIKETTARTYRSTRGALLRFLRRG